MGNCHYPRHKSSDNNLFFFNTSYEESKEIINIKTRVIENIKENVEKRTNLYFNELYDNYYFEKIETNNKSKIYLRKNYITTSEQCSIIDIFYKGKEGFNLLKNARPYWLELLDYDYFKNKYSKFWKIYFTVSSDNSKMLVINYYCVLETSENYFKIFNINTHQLENQFSIECMIDYKIEKNIIITMYNDIIIIPQNPGIVIKYNILSKIIKKINISDNDIVKIANIYKHYLFIVDSKNNFIVLDLYTESILFTFNLLDYNINFKYDSLFTNEGDIVSVKDDNLVFDFKNV